MSQPSDKLNISRAADWVTGLLSADPGLDDADGDLLAALVDTTPTARPSPGVRERLMHAARANPFAPFTAAIGALFEIERDAVRDQLASLKADETWENFVPGQVWLAHVQGGPALAQADVGYVRVSPNVAFPGHEHHGEERTLVLQGSLIDEAGTTYLPGDRIDLSEGAHRFSAGPEGLTFAVVVWGVTFTESQSTT